MTESSVTDLDEALDAELVPELPRRRRSGRSRPPPHRAPRARPAAAPANFYPDVAAWVAGFLAPLYAREWDEMDRERRWCASWWLHVEAVVRLEAMWRAWELLRLDPGLGASIWLLHHADPNMAALTSPAGTFRRCKPGVHRAFDPLPVVPPPPGLFGDCPQAAGTPSG